ncbi:sulfite exporter TauE/SafE family protein [Verticiella alkaliphila]|uniref:sulfite exporter TauE/SafE family protein n=1 Tax=Verticiella alkaliphila TaxID=2779529 RepID=UPI00209A98CD|nr:sulfite exporter TauE/SafE family protein [Verticiella sp. GG226]
MSFPQLMDLALWLALGAGLGVLGGFFGIGGGLIAIPLLSFLAGMSQQVAQGTALILVLPTVLLAAWRYHQKSRIDFARVALIAVCAIGFTWVGAQAALGLDSTLLRRAFAAFLALTALQYVWQVRRRALPLAERTRVFTQPAAALLGVAGGLLGGFFGVGAGILVAPVLTGVFGASQTVAQGVALATVVPTALVSLVSYGAAGAIDWTVGLPLAAGALLMVSPGVRLAHRLPERRLKLAFAALLAITSAGLWLIA